MTEQRDLLLVPFPFSDQSGMKVRPVVVVSNNKFNQTSEDLIVVGVTSNISKDKYAISLDDENLEDGKLFDLCSIKVENILRIDKDLIVKKIGRLKKEKFREVLAVLNSILIELSKTIKRRIILKSTILK